jgi:outer membrane lipopolysaccharide assembly protein LptE/RlpB
MAFREVVLEKLAEKAGFPVEELDFSKLEFEFTTIIVGGGYYAETDVTFDVDGFVGLPNGETKFLSVTVERRFVQNELVQEAFAALVEKETLARVK